MYQKQISQNRKQKLNRLCSRNINRNIKKKNCRGIIEIPRKLKEGRNKKKKATRSPSNYLMIRCYLNLMKDKIQKQKKIKVKCKES